MGTIKVSGRLFDCQIGETIYSSVLRQGVELPRSCLTGTCGRCRVRVTKGADGLGPVTNLEINTLERTASGGVDAKTLGHRLSCLAVISCERQIEIELIDI